MNRWVGWYPVVALLLFVSCQPEPIHEQRSAGTIAAIDSLLQDAVEREHIPGGVIRIQQGDSLWHFEAYGFAQKYAYGMEVLEEPEVMTRSHMFDLASLTKVFGTTFGIMMLKDRGEIELDGPIGRYLPGFDMPEDAESRITIRHLLTHTSGLVQWYPLYYASSTPEQRRRVVAEMPLKWEVGAARHYSDLGFMLLGDIVEEVSGRPLAVFLNEELYQPLGLKRTAFNPLDDGHTRIAATSHGNPFERQMVYDDDFGYSVDVDPESWDGWRQYTLQGEVNDGNAWYANGGVAGHAGLFSTVDDLQVLVDLLLNKGRLGDKQLISSSVVDAFLTKDTYGNALGWAMEKDIISAEGSPKGTFGHTGFTGTNIVVVPEDTLSIILLTNRQNVGPRENGYYFDLGTLRQSIFDKLSQH